jgi:hypothetical protein
MSLLVGEPGRIPLDEPSWLEHVPCWLDPDAAASLTAGAKWEQRKRWMIHRFRRRPATGNAARRSPPGIGPPALRGSLTAPPRISWRV